MSTTKVCARCQEEKPPEAFGRNSGNRDGLQRRCRPCAADYERERRLAEPPTDPPPADESWRDSAACRGLDTDLWFPERGEATAAAKRVCSTCPARERCLEYALDNGIHHGLWGGVSERGRRQMRRGRGGRRAS